jgi:hypothetical protein
VDYWQIQFGDDAFVTQHPHMQRVDPEKTIETLLTLDRVDVPVRVDAIVDAYLVGWDPQEFCSKRSELAHEFLNAAPFTELSYFIWRRIAGEDGDDCANSQFAFTTPSERFLPQVEFR